jgi:hypothetical protein
MSKAYIKKVHANTSDSHQTSPGWMLTFVRWENRSPKTISENEATVSKDNKEKTPSVVKPLVVINDCISVSVSTTKTSHTPQMSAILKAGDINYLTAVAPGDFVFVNIVDWDTKIPELKEKALGRRPINGTEDGFKGVFKVQSVRQVLSTNPGNGARDIAFQIEGFAFTEFNNVIYFNQYLIPPGAEKTPLYVSNISTYWQSEIADGGGLPDCQKMITTFIRTFLGEGVPQNFRKIVSENSSTPSKSAKTAEINYNLQFKLPDYVGGLLGLPEAKAAKDVYTYILGIQEYDNFSKDGSYRGFIPKLELSPKYNSFYQTPKRCQGTSQIKPDYWNQVPVWSILQEYLNSPINEMYTCFRVHPNGKSVVPTVVMRQIPFSSPKYEGESTKFLNLPRWKIDPKMIYNLNIGRDESLRVNFVQVFGIMAGTLRPDLALSYQMASDNTVLDEDDIKRSGMRPWVITSNFALPTKDSTEKESFERALVWTKLMGDIVIGQHLKLNGTFTCAGIEEPIAVGDNVQVGDNVFHIESLTHTASIAANGEKTFNTTIEASHGLSQRTDSASGKVYGQMQREKMLLEREDDHSKEKILPGVSDTQTNYEAPYTDTEYRSNNRSFQKLRAVKTNKKDRKQIK